MSKQMSKKIRDTKSKVWKAQWAWGLALLFGLWGCNNDVPRPAGVQSNILIIEQGAQILAPDVSSFLYSLRVTDGSTSTNNHPTEVSWSSSAPQVATVRHDGLLQINGPGVCMLTAQGKFANETLTASVPLKIAYPEPFRVSPALVSLFSGEAQKLETIFFASPHTSFSYKSLNTAVAAVNSIGLVSGKQAGFTSIRVTGKSATGYLSIDVPVQVWDKPQASRNVAYISMAPGAFKGFKGENVVFTPKAYSVTGSVIDGAAFTFQSSNPSVVTVEANGKATILAPGRAKITAASGGVLREAFIEAIDETAIIVESAGTNVAPGSVKNFTAKLINTRTGEILETPQFTWGLRKISTGYEGSLLDAGVVQSGAGSADSSSAYINAISGNLIGTAQINVLSSLIVDCGESDPDVDTVLISNTSPINLTTGGAPVALNFRIQGYDGQPVDYVTPRFMSEDPSVAVVSEEGKIYAVGAGVTQITVCVGTEKAVVQVSVN